MAQKTNQKVWAAISSGVASDVCELIGAKFVTALGSAGGATTVALEVSPDKSLWVSAGNQVLAGAGPFNFTVTTGAPYARLTTTASVTLTGWISAKD